MKILQKIGLGLFLVGIGIFTANIFCGRYEIDTLKIENYFNTTQELDAGDTIATNFAKVSKQYLYENSKQRKNTRSFVSSDHGDIKCHTR